MNWKDTAKRYRRILRMELRGSKWLRDQLVAMSEQRRDEREWYRRQDGNREEVRT